MSSTNTNVLITGGNRGIGKGLVASYLSLPSHTVIVTVRDPSHPTSIALSSLPVGSNSRLIILHIADIASADAITSGITTLKTKHNISALDVVIANAGFAGLTNKLIDTPVSELQKYIDINAYGPFELYKATLPLLQGSEKPKFCFVSSAAGSLSSMNDMIPLAPYGASKALGNFMFKWLSLEQREVVVWCQHPGMVRTETNEAGFVALKEQGTNLLPYTISVEESANGIRKVIEDAGLEMTHGKFLDQEGKELSW